MISGLRNFHPLINDNNTLDILIEMRICNFSNVPNLLYHPIQINAGDKYPGVFGRFTHS